MTVTPMVRTELDDAGRLVRAWIPSRTQAGHIYEMVRLPSGWAHTDTRCRAWVGSGECYHIRDLKGVCEMTDDNETRALTVQLSPLALMDDIDVAQMMTKKLEPVADWIYSFTVKGQNVTGVSARGVQDAARALSTQGEAIRVLDVRLEREDDNDAYFIATAARFAISATGQEIETDRTIRAKRQPKYMKLRDGGTQFNEFWFEIGVTKAARNATEALLPAVLRDYMKEQAKALVNGTPAQRQAASTRVGVVKNNDANPRNDTVTLMRRVREETSESPAAELHARWPEVFTDKGGAALSKASEEDIAAINSYLRELLGEAVGA